MTAQTQIDHVIIVVHDLERATSDYSLLLARRPSWQGSHPDHGTANTLFKLDNIYIELLAAAGQGMAADIVTEMLENRGECLGGLVFATPNVEAFVAHARASGLAVSDPMAGSGIDKISGATRRWHNVFWDPTAARGLFSFCIQHDPASELPEAAITQGGAIYGVDHVVVKTSSASAAKRFYGDQLGIRLALEQHVPEWGGTQLFFRASSMSIEVIASETAHEQDELWGIALKSEDIESTHQRLIDAGVNTSDIRAGRKPGTRVCTVKSHTCGVPTLIITDRS